MGRQTLSSIALLLPLLATTAAAEPAAPRGVGPEFAKFYADAGSFTCISNPGITLDRARLNDDYCDCPDGSDEPGTAACAYLSPLSPPQPARRNLGSFDETPALPGFYCNNKGHRPSYLPFTSINDGKCDYDVCCDGSDEHAGVGGVKCPDKCAAIGKEWRKQDAARQKSLGNAQQKRRELVAESARLRKEVEDRISTLQAQIEGQTQKVAALTASLADIERAEKGRVVRGAGAGGKIAVLAGLAKDRIAELTTSVERVRRERDAARGRIDELEAMLKRFKDEYNPNFNDEGVKRAVKAWEDYAAQDWPAPDAALDRDLDDMVNPESESAIKWADFETPDADDVDVLYQFELYLPDAIRTWVDTKLRDLRIMLIDNGILPSAPTSDVESKAVTDAKSQLDAAKRDLSTSETELTKHTDDLSKDYGPDAVFRALTSHCISLDSGEYTYEHCFLRSTTQKSKKGHSHTNMGNFAAISSISVDEELPADGRGLGKGERLVLKYEGGQGCWNGPARSTTVVLACAEKEEIWRVVEEEKCVYRMEVGSPSVCGVEVHSGDEGVPAHGEL